MTEVAVEDWNDYLYYAEVVKHGGFAAAGRALLVPRSRLSRRVAGLERRFGVKLIDRSPHSFAVTEIGQDFYQRCRAMLLEADRARSAISTSKGEPEGVLRLSCPPVLIDACVAAVLGDFLALHPRVNLHVLSVDRPVDLVAERVHVAVRTIPRHEDDADADVIRLGPSRDLLVAAPALAAEHAGSDVESLGRLPTISLVEPVSDWSDTDRWNLTSETGEELTIIHKPRLLCRSVPAALSAVTAGTGFALLPEHSCTGPLATGELVRVWPTWGRTNDDIGLLTTTRRGTSPAVRALLDFLVARLG